MQVYICSLQNLNLYSYAKYIFFETIIVCSSFHMDIRETDILSSFPWV